MCVYRWVLVTASPGSSTAPIAPTPPLTTTQSTECQSTGLVLSSKCYFTLLLFYFCPHPHTVSRKYTKFNCPPSYWQLQSGMSPATSEVNLFTHSTSPVGVPVPTMATSRTRFSTYESMLRRRAELNNPVRSLMLSQYRTPPSPHTQTYTHILTKMCVFRCHQCWILTTACALLLWGAWIKKTTLRSWPSSWTCVRRYSRQHEIVGHVDTVRTHWCHIQQWILESKPMKR